MRLLPPTKRDVTAGASAGDLRVQESPHQLSEQYAASGIPVPWIPRLHTMNPSFTARVPLWGLLLLAWTIAGCALSVARLIRRSSSYAGADGYPGRVSASDSTAAEIWATILKGNKPIADSTLVVFASTAVSITPSSLTRDGLAIAVLQSVGDGRPQRVEIVAQALSVRDTLEVDFVILE